MRFEVIPSNVVDNAWFVKDTVGNLMFPTSTNKFLCDFYCKALNELYEENQALKIKIEELEEEFYEYEVINGYRE